MAVIPWLSDILCRADLALGMSPLVHMGKMFCCAGSSPSSVFSLTLGTEELFLKGG